ncbi:MAG: hypothetical protein AAGD25_25770 [Cyanobacteria bacterium P01_F01_bin.150]
MDSNIRSATIALRPLSPGDSISAGIQLYRNHIKLYLTLSAVSHLWLLVPVYGWAKYIMTAGLMSRFAFQELIDEPETVAQSRAKLNARLWSFLWLVVQLGLRWIGVYILSMIALFFITALFGLAIGVLVPVSPIFSVIGGFVILGTTLFFLYAIVRIFLRWYISDVPLSVEKGITAGQSINRSWTLSQRLVGRIQIVIILSFLVTWPLSVLTSLASRWMSQLLLDQLFLGLEGTFTAGWLIFVLGWAIGSIVLLPFWQIIKAVMYYDFRCRQEGLDLELRH